MTITLFMHQRPFTAKTQWFLYAGNPLAPLRRKFSGSFMPKAKWFHSAENSHTAAKAGVAVKMAVDIPIGQHGFVPAGSLWLWFPVSHALAIMQGLQFA